MVEDSRREQVWVSCAVVYVSHEPQDFVSVIDTATNSVVTTRAIGGMLVGPGPSSTLSRARSRLDLPSNYQEDHYGDGRPTATQ